MSLILASLSPCLAQGDPWHELPAIPDQNGFAGMFAGTSHGALIVAGGTNIPKDTWAESFQKVWYDSIYVLEQPHGNWRYAGKLPAPRAYGVSVNVDSDIVWIGGSDATRHYADVFRLRYDGEQIHCESLPSLPRPCANACGAVIGRTIYIAGGIASPGSTEALKTFWAMDLDNENLQWKELQPWPGAGRMLAVAGVKDGSFFIFGGVSLRSGEKGHAKREYLANSYQYCPGSGWTRLPDMPHAVAAAPSPALLIGNKLLLVSGDDGTNVDFQPVINHPGFLHTIQAYDVDERRWTAYGEAPFSIATAPAVFWRSGIVIPGGETRPRVRSSKVWWFSQTFISPNK